MCLVVALAVAVGILTETLEEMVRLSEPLEWVLALASFRMQRPEQQQLLVRALGWKMLKPKSPKGPRRPEKIRIL